MAFEVNLRCIASRRDIRTASGFFLHFMGRIRVLERHRGGRYLDVHEMSN